MNHKNDFDTIILKSSCFKKALFSPLFFFHALGDGVETGNRMTSASRRHPAVEKVKFKVKGSHVKATNRPLNATAG